MNKQLQRVSFEQAMLLTEVGFYWDTFAPAFWYDELGNLNSTSFYPLIYYPAPTTALVLKWFRDVKGLFGYVIFNTETFSKGYEWYYFSFSDKTISNRNTLDCIKSSYELAESALVNSLIGELLNLIEKEKENESR